LNLKQSVLFLLYSMYKNSYNWFIFKLWKSDFFLIIGRTDNVDFEAGNLVFLFIFRSKTVISDSLKIYVRVAFFIIRFADWVWFWSIRSCFLFILRMKIIINDLLSNYVTVTFLSSDVRLILTLKHPVMFLLYFQYENYYNWFIVNLCKSDFFSIKCTIEFGCEAAYLDLFGPKQAEVTVEFDFEAICLVFD